MPNFGKRLVSVRRMAKDSIPSNNNHTSKYRWDVNLLDRSNWLQRRLLFIVY